MGMPSMEGTFLRALLQHVVDSYYDDGNHFAMEIRKTDADTLQVAFQALDSQSWGLQYYKHGTFIWLPSRDNIVKGARFPYAGKGLYTLIFQTSSDGKVDRLLWPHNPNLPAEEQPFQKLGNIEWSSMKCRYLSN